MSDLARIKRNVSKMASMNAPEEDIDGYIASEGTTIDAVRDFRPGQETQSQTIASSAPAERSPLQSPAVRGDPPMGGAALNATAGANEALYGILGAPVDLVRGAMNLGIRGVNAASGSEIAPIPEDSFGGSRSIAQGMGAVSPVLDPRNTVASTTEDRIARGVGAGVAGSVLPAGMVGAASRAGAIGPAAAEIGAQVLGRSGSVGAVAGEAAVGGISGAGASAAMEAVPDEYKPIAGMAGGLLAGGGATLAAGIPGAVLTSGRVAGDYLAPATEAGRERLAAERLRGSATDIDAVRETLDNLPKDLVPGSQPTTGQVTGDLGILGAERGAAVKSPELFAQRRADQNAARVGSLEGMQKGGAPEKVADALRSRLKTIEDGLDDIEVRARSEAQGRAGGIGQGMDPSTAGDRLRGSLEAARAQAKEQEKALWSAVDPDGTLVLATGNARQQLKRETQNQTMSGKPPAEEEAAIYEVLGQYREAMPFREVSDLQSRVKTAMRSERMANGESMAYGRMSRLNSAIYKDLEQATAAKVQQEERAVAAGQMRQEDTLAAALQRETENWRAGRETQVVGGNGPTSFAGNPTGRASGLLGSSRAEGQTGQRSANAPSNPRLPPDGLEPNFDPEALGRLTAARDATRERVQTFDNKLLAPMRKRPATNAPYEMASGDVAGRVFFPQAKSADAIQQFRQAVGDTEALPVLQEYAIGRLRRVALRDDGSFDAGKLDNWRRAHADALRAFPDLDRSLADAGRAAETLGTVQKQRTAAVSEAQKGALGRFLHLDTPEDVTRTVGSMFGAQDSMNRFLKLRSAIGKDKEAQQGLRQAIADHIRMQLVGNTEAGTSGIGTVKSDQFQTFFRKNLGALKVAGFTDDEVKTMGAIAEDLQRANRSVAAVKNPGGSDTAQNLYAASRGDKPSILGRLVANLPAAVGGVGGFVAGGPFTAIAGAVGAKTLADIRLAGISGVDDLVADALLNPQRAKLLLSKPTTRANETATLQMLGQLYRRSVAVSGGTSLSSNGDQDEGDGSLQVTIATGRR